MESDGLDLPADDLLTQPAGAAALEAAQVALQGHRDLEMGAEDLPTQPAGAAALEAAQVAWQGYLDPVVPVLGELVAPDVAAALVAEEELPALVATVKRKHIHYTHVRTHDPSHRQPDSFTRAEFWAHLVKVYLEAYPVKGQTDIYPVVRLRG